MRIWTISDLHLTNTNPSEFGSRLKIPNAGICALAGDICDDLEAGIRWVGAVIAPHMPVVMVLGNHDYFGRSLTTAVKEAREIALDAVVKRDSRGNPTLDASGNIQRHHPIFILDDDAELVLRNEGVRFVGATMWTDFAVLASEDDDHDAIRQQTMEAMAKSMPEYGNVYLFRDPKGIVPPQSMRPVDAFSAHDASRKALIRKLAKPFRGQTVVMTHHAPHPRSISTYFGDNKLTPGFVSDMSDVMERYEPDLWIHGHVHESFDYQVGITRIFCHAQGRNPKFSWQGGIIELPKSKPALSLRKQR